MMGSIVAFEVLSGMCCGVAEMPIHFYEEGTASKERRALYN